jgi:hypothetical protein
MYYYKYIINPIQVSMGLEFNNVEEDSSLASILTYLYEEIGDKIF